MNQFQDDLFAEEAPKQEIKRPCIKCKKNSPYQCPKCKCFYCSLPCYQTHNLNCTEGFYKENVIQHLKGKKVSKEEAEKMRKLLEKAQESETITDYLSEQKQKRLEEILDNLESGEMTLDKLSPDELQEFEAFIRDRSNLETILKEWIPWWKRELFSYNLDIKEVETTTPQFSDEKEEKLWAYRFDMRERYEKLPHINQLTKIAPNPALINHIIQFIFACAYLAREYNGDLKNCHEEVLPALHKIAPCLAEKVDLPTIEVAINTAIQNARKVDGTDATQFISIAISDLYDIFSNKFYLFEVIFKYYDVFHYAHEYYADMLEKEMVADNKKKEVQQYKKKISAVKQKLLFYLSYLKGKPQKELSEIAAAIKQYERNSKKDQLLNQEMEKLVKNFDQKVTLYN